MTYTSQESGEIVADVPCNRLELADWVETHFGFRPNDWQLAWLEARMEVQVRLLLAAPPSPGPRFMRD